MQERRMTIRRAQPSRAQYCPSEDLLPRDGRVMNLSERGAGILTRETHQEGERITVTVPVEGDAEPLTASGQVRWSSLKPFSGRWHATGLEWLPLDEPTKNRLHRALAQRPSSFAPSAAAGGKRRSAIGWFLGGSFIVALLAGIGIFWVLSLQGENQALGQAIEQRNMLIGHLERQEARLSRELKASKAHLAASASEVARLDQQAQTMGGRITHLSGEVVRVQKSYDEVREERERLIKQVLDLQQERTALAKRLASVPDLRLAIREAVDARKIADQERRRMIQEARRQEDLERLANGNRGFLTKDGRSTISKETVWIRVLDPASGTAQSSEPGS